MNKLFGPGEFSDNDEVMLYIHRILGNGNDVRIHPYMDGTYDLFELKNRKPLLEMRPGYGTKLQ